jgi:hypothetical protein
MKGLLLVAAAATLVACHNRGEDETGAAPARADTTAVTRQVDPDRTGPPGEAGRPGNATITPDSIVGDSARIDSTGVRVDTTGQTGQSPVSVPQDTLGPRNPDTTNVNSTQPDTNSTGR